MKEFIAKHREEIAGVWGFDRLIFRGTLRSISYPEGMMGYLWAKQVRLTEFGRHVLRVSDPLVSPVTPADRLALLLERIDDLRCAATRSAATRRRCSAGFVARIDRLKDEMVTRRASYRAGRTTGERAAARRRRARPRRARAASSRGCTRTHDRLLDEAGALDFGDLILHAFRLLHEQPARARSALAERYRAVLVDEYQDTNFAQGMLLRLLGEEHRNVDRGGRRRPGDLPLPRGVAEEHARLPARAPGRQGRPARAQLPLGPAHPRRRGRRGGADRGARIEKRLRRRERRRSVRFWRCRSERAQAQAVAAEVERLIARRRAARGDLRAGALGEERGPAVGAALEERAIPFRLVGRGGVLPARRGARPARVAARCWPTRPTRAPWCARSRGRRSSCARSTSRGSTQLARRRKLDMVAAAGGRARGPAALARGARPGRSAFLRLYRSAVERVRRDAPGRVRAPADRARRPAPPAGVRHAGRHGRAAGATSPSSPTSPPRTCAASRRPRPRDFARYIAAVAEAGLREEEAAETRPAPARAGDDDARAPRASSSTTCSSSACSANRMPGHGRGRATACRTSC